MQGNYQPNYSGLQTHDNGAILCANQLLNALKGQTPMYTIKMMTN